MHAAFVWTARLYPRILRWILVLPLAGLMAGCSIKQLAVNKLGDALAGGGTTFASDNDPELVRAAVPFSLKLIESLLAESPRHRGLLLAACSGFTQFSYAFVNQDADEMEETDLRSEERRVGKECRSEWEPYKSIKNIHEQQDGRDVLMRHTR